MRGSFCSSLAPEWADLQRPAAIDQLHVLGEQLEIPVYSNRGQSDPVTVCKAAVKQAKSVGADVVILDTAGRLHVDQELMGQLGRIDRQCQPDQVYLVVDGMTGQDAVNSAKAFNQALELDGLVMTKLDGDARGGAALSLISVTSCPIKFVGTGEKLDALDAFHPDRMADQILGMGDIVSLVEKAQEVVDQEKALKFQEKARKANWDFDDFLGQMQEIKKMGSFGDVMKKIPGINQFMGSGADMEELDDDGLKYVEAIIYSMTKQERRKPKILNGSRRKRIAAGSGTAVQDVNRLIKDFDKSKKMMKQMMKQMKKGGKKGKGRGMSLPGMSNFPEMR